MTNAGLPVPPGFTISTDVCNIYYQREGEDPAGDRPRDRRARQEAREGRRRDARLDREPAARLGPLGREVLDARHDGHDSQPRAERRGRRRAEGADQQRPLRVRQLSPLHPDVRQRRPRDSEGRRSSTSSRRSRHATSAKLDTDLDEAALREVVDALQGGRARTRPARRSRRIRCEQLHDGARRRVPLVDERARARNTAASTTSRITSAPPSTCR